MPQQNPVETLLVSYGMYYQAQVILHQHTSANHLYSKHILSTSYSNINTVHNITIDIDGMLKLAF